MITDLRVWLDSLDGAHVAASALGAFLVLWLYCELVNARARNRARVRGPRRESHSETAHRLDAEAARATRPASSSRKAGRVPSGGTR